MNNQDFNPFIVNCPSCGSAAEDFDIVRQEYKCRHCGSSVSAHDAKLRFDEWAHGHAEETARTVAKTNEGGKFFCPNCGAEANITSHARDELVQVKCEYCETRFVAAPAGKTFTSPDTIIPFFITLDEAKMRLRQWCEKNSRKQEAHIALGRIDELRGMYLPYEVVKGPIRFTVSRDQSDRTYTCGGYLDGTAVSVSKNQHNLTLDAMEPFDWSGARPYDAGLITGQTVKLRDADAAQADYRVKQEVAAAYRPRMEEVMKTKGLTIASNDSDGQDWIRASALLPAYVLDCAAPERTTHFSVKKKRKRRKKRRSASGPRIHFAVNGQTGRVAVESLTPRKIGLFWWVPALLTGILPLVIAVILGIMRGNLNSEYFQFGGIISVIFSMITFTMFSQYGIERHSIDYAISGEQVKAKRNGSQLVVENAELPPSTATPVFFEKVRGKETQVSISFFPVFRVIKIILGSLAVMFLPYVIVLPFALARGMGNVHWGYGMVWLMITGLTVPVFVMRQLYNWIFDEPVVREITAGGATRRIEKGDLDKATGSTDSFFKNFSYAVKGGGKTIFFFLVVFPLIILIMSVATMLSSDDSEPVTETAAVSTSDISQSSEDTQSEPQAQTVKTRQEMYEAFISYVPDFASEPIGTAYQRFFGSPEWFADNYKGRSIVQFNGVLKVDGEDRPVLMLFDVTDYAQYGGEMKMEVIAMQFRDTKEIISDDLADRIMKAPFGE